MAKVGAAFAQRLIALLQALHSSGLHAGADVYAEALAFVVTARVPGTWSAMAPHFAALLAGRADGGDAERRAALARTMQVLRGLVAAPTASTILALLPALAASGALGPDPEAAIVASRSTSATFAEELLLHASAQWHEALPAACPACEASAPTFAALPPPLPPRYDDAGVRRGRGPRDPMTARQWRRHVLAVVARPAHGPAAAPPSAARSASLSPAACRCAA